MTAECPCGRAADFDACCGRYLARAESAPDAEALMRSRYTAYVRRDEAYLLATWHPSTRPASLGLASDAAVRWLGLDVRRHDRPGEDRARVEFVARYRVGGRAVRLHEVSRFVREDGRWYYVDGDLAER